eukprot:363429-Chlamydomonas_euryale.AAC.13
MATQGSVRHRPPTLLPPSLPPTTATEPSDPARSGSEQAGDAGLGHGPRLEEGEEPPGGGLMATLSGHHHHHQCCAVRSAWPTQARLLHGNT